MILYGNKKCLNFKKKDLKQSKFDQINKIAPPPSKDISKEKVVASST